MIDSYDWGRIVVDGTSYTADVIIFPDHVQSDWWRKEGHSLVMDDLGTVVDYGPEVLVVGTGALGAMKVPGSTAETLKSKGIALEIAKTNEACRKFNELLASGKRVVAGLHLTC